MEDSENATDDSKPTRRLSTASSGTDESEELTTLIESLQNENRHHTVQYSDIHWLFILNCLVMSSISLSCSITYLLQPVRNSTNMSDIWDFILDAIIAGSSLIIFCLFLPIWKPRLISPSSTLVFCLFCTIFNLLSAAIIFALYYDRNILGILLSNIFLYFLLYVQNTRLKYITR